MKPLTDVRVAVTRAQGQAEELASPLRELGAQVVTTPLIRIVASYDSANVRVALANLESYDWLVFTSANGVDVFFEAIQQHGARPLRFPALACVGPATEEALRRHGLESTLVPDDFVGEAVADAMTARDDLAGKRVLLARAGGARDVLPERLRSAGAVVSDIELYRSEPDEEGARALRAEIAAQTLDLITLQQAPPSGTLFSW